MFRGHTWVAHFLVLLGLGCLLHSLGLDSGRVVHLCGGIEHSRSSDLPLELVVGEEMEGLADFPESGLGSIG